MLTALSYELCFSPGDSKPRLRATAGSQHILPEENARTGAGGKWQPGPGASDELQERWPQGQSCCLLPWSKAFLSIFEKWETNFVLT